MSEGELGATSEAQLGPSEKKHKQRKTSEAITARRLRLLIRAALDEHLISKTIKDLAVDLKVSEKCIREDWRNRRSWAPAILSMDTSEAETTLIRLFNKWAMSTDTLLRIGVDSENYKAFPRVMALRALTESICREIEKRQSLGYLPKVAEKLEVTEQGDINKLLEDLKILEPVWRGEVKRIISEIDIGDDPNKQIHKNDAESKTDPVPPTP
jgi:hypothetical protein